MQFQSRIKYWFIKVVTLLIFVGLSQMAFAQKATQKKRKALESERKVLESRIALTKKVLEQNKQEQLNSLNQLNVIGSQIKIRENIIDNIGQQIFELSLDVQAQKSVVESLKNDLDNLKKDYADNIVAAYKARSALDKVVFIFNSKDFNQAFRRIKYLGQYSNYRQQQAQLILKTQKNIINEINVLIAIKQEKMNLIGMKEQEKSLLEKDKETKQVVLTKLQRSEKDLRTELANQEKTANKLQQAIKVLIAKEIEEARRAEEARQRAIAARAAAKAAKEKATVKKSEPVNAASAPTISPEMLKLSNDFEANKGKLPWPVDNGFISGSYGVHPHPTLKGVKTTNNGINITTKKGSQARSIFKGTVKAIFTVPGLERVVLVNHGEYYSVYANLEAINVKIGDELKTGEVIGNIFTNDDGSKTEMHLEIYKLKEMQNPSLWLTK